MRQDASWLPGAPAASKYDPQYDQYTTAPARLQASACCARQVTASQSSRCHVPVCRIFWTVSCRFSVHERRHLCTRQRPPAHDRFQIRHEAGTESSVYVCATSSRLSNTFFCAVRLSEFAACDFLWIKQCDLNLTDAPSCGLRRPLQPSCAKVPGQICKTYAMNVCHACVSAICQACCSGTQHMQPASCKHACHFFATSGFTIAQCRHVLCLAHVLLLQ